ncbi:conserved hypothetical protein [Trichinella spiralis]|uniref:hypothetical protein n=1 Tax=Trichinella spiralis TaxID=6334 RepID=UPI0001EFDE90|nr:conserved hypothetical protein [Trichinella spiralis]
MNTALWWHGPPWLMQGRENWPTEPVVRIDDNEHLTVEQKTVKVLASQTDGCGVEQVINPTRYSRYETLIRVTAYCLRFARNCQNSVSERTNNVNLSVKELSDAETLWLREVQVKEFGIKPDSANRSRRTSEAIHSASRVQTSNHPPSQSPGDRAANQRSPRQADTCRCHPNPGSHQNKILDHQSQKCCKEDNPLMSGMSQSRCATLPTPNG